MKGYQLKMLLKGVEISKPVAYIWQDRWNREGYEGLKPKFAGESRQNLMTIKKTN